jgi:type IV secretory pathway VirD2 relaxase
MESLGDLPIFRPRIGGRRSPRGQQSRFRNALLSWARPRTCRRTIASSAASGFGDRSRRVVVKAHVARLRAGGAKAAALHLRYIERDGVEKDGSRGVLYGADGPLHAETFEQPRLAEKHQFRIIVAPEDGSELDLTAYVRRLMGQVERDLGRKVEWAAVNHYDTAHPHAHLVVRGVDRKGRELRLDRAYISNGMRSRAQELATQELGPRRHLDVQRARAHEVTQDRLTSLDREIDRRASSGRVDVRSLQAGRADAATLVARLEHIEGLRLVARESRASWTLSPGWQEQLRELGARGDILKQMHRAVAGDRTRYRILRPGEPLDVERPDASPVQLARVASKGLSDELKGAFYAVLETPSGHAYHVPLDARGAETLRPGDLVHVTTRREPAVRPVDHEVARASQAAGGVYTLEPTVDAASHPHVRRLRELERLGLAAADGPLRWRVSPTLLDDLQERHRVAPARYRLLTRQEPLTLEQQVHHAGDTWLDRVEPDACAPYGFGLAVRRALEQRREVLRERAVGLETPNPSEKVPEEKRRAVGREMAARSGQVFLAEPPEGFSGRMSLPGIRTTATAYVVVSDGSRFVLLHANESLRTWSGRTVVVTCDAGGQPVVRPARERNLGR